MTTDAKHAGCLFCAIASGAVPAEQIAFANGFVAFLDIDPITPGHCLVIPSRHVVELEDQTTVEWLALGDMLRKVRGMLSAALVPDGISLMQNGGRFADTAHFHVHVIPRHLHDVLAGHPATQPTLTTRRARDPQWAPGCALVPHPDAEYQAHCRQQHSGGDSA